MDNESPNIEDLGRQKSMETSQGKSGRKQTRELQQEHFGDQTQPPLRGFNPGVGQAHRRNTAEFNGLFSEFLRENIRGFDRRFAESSRRMLQQQVDQLRGLTSKRIEKFEHFDADESMAGEQCMVCLNDLEKGTKMVRLDCNADHYLCKICSDSWFKNHNTCPACRRTFN